MEDKEQEIAQDNQMISPIVKDRTFGERAYDITFNNIINFWVNLIASAGFTYWVYHSHNPIKLPFMKKAELPPVIQENLAAQMQKLPILKIFKTQPVKAEVAGSMANALTLVTAGHVVMIPSLWLGPKIKAPFVRFFDRMHYGDDAMEDPTLKIRHAMIEAEERPTFIGAVVGRVGSVIANQAAAYTIGSPINILKWAGKKLNIGVLQKFNGIDDFTAFSGDRLGSMVSEMLPEPTNRLNATLREHRYDFSPKQMREHQQLGITSIAYGDKPLNGKGGGGFNEHFSRYMVSDIMYTIVTATTAVPAINFCKQFIPGLTYKPKINSVTAATIANPGKVRVRPNPIADRADGASVETSPSTDTPHIRVSDIKNLSRVAAVPQQEVGANG